jgi:hypothetical protein
VAHLFFEGLHLFIGIVARHAIAFLQLARKIFGVAFCDFQIVIGKLAPLLLDLAAELFPMPLDGVLIHAEPHWISVDAMRVALPIRAARELRTRPFCVAQMRHDSPAYVAA